MRRAPRLFHVHAARVDIARWLRLEEGLLRHRAREDWLTTLDGAASRAIVLGIGGDVERLVDVRRAATRAHALVRRFTGGGTIACDGDTLFAGFAMDVGGAMVRAPRAYPRDVMRATGDAYARVFDKCGTFALRENDYVFGTRKFGGNAQAIVKGRFLHHTSFLYDYDDDAMAATLKPPPRAPAYRDGRAHADFLARLAERGYARDEIFERVRRVMMGMGYEIVDVGLEDAERAVEDAVARDGGARWDTVKVLSLDDYARRRDAREDAGADAGEARTRAM